MAAKNRSNELRITRIFDAPVKAVWEAWTDEKQLAQWWGPRGFSITTHSRDLRPGGCWKFTMHGPGGVNYPNCTQFLEVEKYQRLVYDHGATDDTPPMFRVTVLFSALEGKTKMEMSMALPTPEAAEATRKIVKQANGNSTWDRLAEYLNKNIAGKEQFIINRSFNAPIKTMFDMWTDPKHVAQWLPPVGFTMEFMRADIRTGGGSFYVVSGKGGVTMYGKAKYLEISSPERIVYTQQFCDEKEIITRHPLAPIWPETMLTTITLAEEDANTTRVTVAWECYGATKPEELAMFIAAKVGMMGGWTGSFDKLETHIESIR